MASTAAGSKLHTHTQSKLTIPPKAMTIDKADVHKPLSLEIFGSNRGFAFSTALFLFGTTSTYDMIHAKDGRLMTQCTLLRVLQNLEFSIVFSPFENVFTSFTHAHIDFKRRNSFTRFRGHIWSKCRLIEVSWTRAGRVLHGFLASPFESGCHDVEKRWMRCKYRQ